MVDVITGGERVYPEDTLITASASELLVDASKVATLWPEMVAANPSLLQQVEHHKAAIDALSDVTSQLPDPTLSLERAFELQLIDAAQIETLYRSLSDLLMDEDSERIALYLPFSFLPDVRWQPEDVNLAKAINLFATSYLFAWQKQLNVQDVRANFTDGDVLEVEQRDGDLARVVKAAHLMPELVARGLISTEAVQDLYDSTEDPILRNSIAEAMAVIRNELSSVEKAPVFEPAMPTVRRKEWLEEKNHQQLIASLAGQLSRLILTYAQKLDELPIELLTSNSDTTRQVFVRGIQTAIEQAAIDGSGNPAFLFDYFRADLLSQWHTSDEGALKDTLTMLFRRMNRLGFFGQPELEALGITSPQLSGNLSANLELMPKEVEQLKQIVTSIEADPILSSMIYPVLSVGGSRLKGYGTETSDLDTAIFIRPVTSTRQGRRIRSLLTEHFKAAGINDEPVEFWLDHHEDTLKIRPVSSPEAVVADQYWTHVLFGSAFVGNPREVETLQKKLLLPYFSGGKDMHFGRTNRALYLEKIEQDMLQYRLLHKGYERHYPRVTAVDSRTDPIDGDSVFWDAGYRRLATQLFVEKVFIPKN